MSTVGTVSTPLRWAVVGVGRAGLARARAIQADPLSELVCTWRGRNQQVVGNLAVSSLEEALDRSDAVAICSPDAHHASQIDAALAAQCHVVVEFPICHDAQRSRRLFECARARALVLHVAHIELLHGPQRLLRAALREAPPNTLGIRFERPGAVASQRALAYGNIARLHRLVDLIGTVWELTEIHHQGDTLAATLHGVHGQASFRVRQAPTCVRGTVLTAQNPQGHWRMTGQDLTQNGETRVLPQLPGLFAQDHHEAMRRITRGSTGYISEKQILHILDLAERLADGREGPLPAHL